MSTRMIENLIKAFFFTAVFIVLLLQSVFSSAQTAPRSEYKGLDVRFGSRSFDIQSNVKELNYSTIAQLGGHAGVLYGNHIIRVNAGAGYYTSDAAVAGTLDLYEAIASANFYPLSALLGRSSKIEPYLTVGMAYNMFKFYGYYISKEPGTINHSQGEAPYLGSIRQVNTYVGAGLEFAVFDLVDFVHIFSEMRYGYNVSADSRDQSFQDTVIKNQMHVSVGINFGVHR
jgi:hypothetical protein